MGAFASPMLLPLLGAIAWAIGARTFRPSWALAIFLLAPFVVVPLALRLAQSPDRLARHPRLWQGAIALQLPAAIALMFAFRFPPGPTSAALALPWFLVSLLAALFGLRRLLARGLAHSDELCIDVGCIFLAVGGAWAVLCRTTERPFGFDPLTALLTATHFHYAGFALCVLLGFAGRKLVTGAPRGVMALVIGGIVAMAVGIGAGVAPLERIAGCALALGGCLVAAIHLHLAAQRGSIPFRVLLALSALSIVGALILAALFAIRTWIAVPWVDDLGHMARAHGTASALGFSLAGCFAWTLAPPLARAAPAGIPFSALTAGLRVGVDFFERTCAVAIVARPPRGITDSFDDFQQPSLATARVHPAIRAFYERTAQHELRVRVQWHPAIAWAAPLLIAVAKRVGQLQLPMPSGDALRRIDSRFVALDASSDGRPGARGWIRTCGGSAMSVAAYAKHAYAGIPYLNIAFPLPLASLSSILRVEPLYVGEPPLAIELTTRQRPDPEAASDAGTWLVTPLLGPIKLPIDETIQVWVPSMRFPPKPIDTTEFPGTTVVARHELRVFGVCYVTLEYAMRPIPAMG